MDACRICGGETRAAPSRGETAYARCQQCDALLKDISQTAYAAIDVSYDPGVPVNDMTAEETIRRLDVDGAHDTLSSVFGKFRFEPAGKRLIDIGCGSGRYLLAGKKFAMDTLGIEPSASHSAAGRQLLGLDIRTGYFDEDQFEPNTFDVVILSHVIEHIFFPKPFLNAAYALLRPGGLLVVLTPNASNVIAKLSGGNWSMLAPVDHVSMFGVSSARAVAPAGAHAVLWTTEYPWEPVVTLLVALRNKIKGPKEMRVVAGQTKVEVLHGRKPLSAPFRALCAAVSLPLTLYNRVALKGSCLVAAYQRPARESQNALL